MTIFPLVVIGIGNDGPAGLPPEAREHIARAQVLVGGRRHLAFFPDWPGETVVLGANPEPVVQQLKATYRHKKTVVLASGDPLFYGIGRLLIEHFPAPALRFLPHVSAVQLAFARLGSSWHDACVVSLHGRPMHALLPALHQRTAKIALLTDASNHPAAVARWLMEHHCEDTIIWVCEELGGPGERLTQWTPRNILNQTFSPLNVTILLRQGTPSVADAIPLLGLPEQAIAHHAGMITKRELRLIALGYLALHPDEVLWDIGAGSGAVALEAARLAATLRVFAIERSAQALAQITDNIRTFALPNVQPVLGEAPEALADLPDPHAVFIGGSGGRLAELIPVVVERLHPGGRVVLHCITLEHLSLGWERLRAQELHVDVTSVQLSRARPLGTLHRLASDSPLFILQAHKGIHLNHESSPG
ncbi:Cobalamin biosynthesis bifunctional protein CbiET [Candidatus Entotheonellaceae bacterium PAL068K]